MSDPANLIALVTDDTHDVGPVPVFALDDFAGLATFLERSFLTQGAPGLADSCTED